MRLVISLSYLRFGKASTRPHKSDDIYICVYVCIGEIVIDDFHILRVSLIAIRDDNSENEFC